jgi:hypothetical protein
VTRRPADVPRRSHCDTTRGRLAPHDGLRCRRCLEMPTGLRRRLLQQPNKLGRTVNPGGPTQERKPCWAHPAAPPP